MKKLHNNLLKERQTLLGQLDAYKPRVVLESDTPAQVLLACLDAMLCNGTTANSRMAQPSREQLLQARSALLRGVDVYQPEDIAFKLMEANSGMDVEVGGSLALLLGPRNGQGSVGTAVSARGSASHEPHPSRMRLGSCGGGKQSIYKGDTVIPTAEAAPGCTSPAPGTTVRRVRTAQSLKGSTPSPLPTQLTSHGSGSRKPRMPVAKERHSPPNLGKLQCPAWQASHAIEEGSGKG
jgi:hypothetical protein